MDYSKKVAPVGALQNLARRMESKIPIKASQLANDCDYQTGEQVEEKINAKVSSVYRPGGSVAFAALPELNEANLGLVVNVTDKFTTTDDFLEGAGSKHPAGTNVAVVQVGEAYKYDVLAGFIDLSGYQEKQEGAGLYPDEDKAKLAGLEIATDEEVNTMLDEVFGTGAAG